MTLNVPQYWGQGKHQALATSAAGSRRWCWAPAYRKCLLQRWSGWRRCLGWWEQRWAGRCLVWIPKPLEDGLREHSQRGSSWRWRMPPMKQTHWCWWESWWGGEKRFFLKRGSGRERNSGLTTPGELRLWGQHDSVILHPGMNRSSKQTPLKWLTVVCLKHHRSLQTACANTPKSAKAPFVSKLSQRTHSYCKESSQRDVVWVWVGTVCLLICLFSSLCLSFSV